MGDPRGGGRPGMGGSGGMRPPTGGFPGGMGGLGGMMGGFQLGAPPDEEVEAEPLWVITVVETTNHVDPRMFQNQQTPIYITHKWGATSLYQIDKSTTERIAYKPLLMANGQMMPSVVKRFELEKSKTKAGGQPTAEDLLKLAEWALTHGLLNSYTQVMDELVALDKNHRSAVAYAKVKAALDAAPAASKDAGTWKERLNPSYRTADGGHYTLLHQLPPSEKATVQGRLDRLENTLKGYYYWFALKGVALPVPQQRLLAVLVSQKEEFDRTRQTFGVPFLVSDGFHARRDNLAIFSANRLDEPYVALKDFVKPELAQYDSVQLLKGRASRPEEARAGTALLMLKALEDDAERASVTHEGSRQLLAASGLLPRAVSAPRWLEFGMGSFFETPTGAPWISIATPHPTLDDQNNYLLQYQNAAKKKKLDPPAVALESVVTDRYFHAMKNSKDAPALLKARTMSWALTYFLAQTKLDGLQRYFAELTKLPRDMEFDEETLKEVFARSFNLLDRSGKVDPGQMNRLGTEWHEFMIRTPLELNEILQEVRKTQNDIKSGLGKDNKGNKPPAAGGAQPGKPAGGGPQ
jgi:hypothetical protein